MAAQGWKGLTTVFVVKDKDQLDATKMLVY
jgi:hypothetical protein